MVQKCIHVALDFQAFSFRPHSITFITFDSVESKFTGAIVGGGRRSGYRGYCHVFIYHWLWNIIASFPDSSLVAYIVLFACARLKVNTIYATRDESGIEARARSFCMCEFKGQYAMRGESGNEAKNITCSVDKTVVDE